MAVECLHGDHSKCVFEACGCPTWLYPPVVQRSDEWTPEQVEEFKREVAEAYDIAEHRVVSHDPGMTREEYFREVILPQRMERVREQMSAMLPPGLRFDWGPIDGLWERVGGTVGRSATVTVEERSSVQQEVTAMGVIGEALDGLDSKAQERVIAWIEMRFGSLSPPTPVAVSVHELPFSGLRSLLQGLREVAAEREMQQAEADAEIPEV